MDIEAKRAIIARTDLRFANGKTAIVSGAKEPFAMVTAQDGSIRHEYSWATVAFIVERGMTFRVH